MLKSNSQVMSLSLALLVVAFSGVSYFSRAAQPGATTQPVKAEKAQPQQQKPCMGPGQQHQHCQIFEKLNLTPEQKEKMKAAHQTFREQNAARIEDMKAKRAKLRELGTDPAKEAERQQLRSQLREDREYLKAKHQEATKGILTPEQESRLQALKQECKAKWRKGGGKGPMPEGNEDKPF